MALDWIWSGQHSDGNTTSTSVSNNQLNSQGLLLQVSYYTCASNHSRAQFLNVSKFIHLYLWNVDTKIYGCINIPNACVSRIIFPFFFLGSFVSITPTMSLPVYEFFSVQRHNDEEIFFNDFNLCSNWDTIKNIGYLYLNVKLAFWNKLHFWAITKAMYYLGRYIYTTKIGTITACHD